MTPKYVCITGASSGIGRSTAIAFARLGSNLIIGARRTERLQTLQEELLSAGSPSVKSDVLDVTHQKSIEKFAETTLNFCEDKLDVLVNNAGKALGIGQVKDANLDDWQEMLDTNLMGLARVTQQFLPSMIENKQGHIILIGSIAGHQAYSGGSMYCASKFGVKAIAKSLKLELCGTNIRVSSIDPGMVNTEFSLVRLGDQEKAEEVYKGMKPLSPEDIAECIIFATTRPAHVNIDEIIVMPTAQAAVGITHREE